MRILWMLPRVLIQEIQDKSETSAYACPVGNP